MTRILKTSGFVGLLAMMAVGLQQVLILSSGKAVPGWLVGGHAHLGVLSILAIVVGFTVDALDLVGRVRQAVSFLYVIGQWGLPLTIWGAGVTGIPSVEALTFIAGPALMVSMLVLAWKTATTDASFTPSSPVQPADD